MGIILPIMFVCQKRIREKFREEITDNANYMKEATGYEMDRFFPAAERRIQRTHPSDYKGYRLYHCLLEYGLS